MVKVKVTVKGLPDLSTMSRDLKDPNKFLHNVQAIRRSSFYINIADGKDSSGKKFTPLSSKYAKYKKKKVGSKPILSFSGSMIASYDSEVEGNQLIEQVKSPIAIFHQEGTGRLPKRSLLPDAWEDIPLRERKEILKAADEFVEDIINRLARST